jgi:hypothetical protein
MAVKDSTTGKFIKEASVTPLADAAADQDAVIESLRKEIETLRLQAELAVMKAGSEEAPESTPEPARTPTATLRLQSRFRNHAVQIVATRRVFHVGGGVEPVPGVAARFVGPQRIFDSVAAAKEWGWSEETRDKVERALVSKPEFMTDYFPAPMSPLPEHLLAFARVRPPELRKKCEAFGYDERGNLTQCVAEHQAGSRFCYEHDPERDRILKGGGTTL